MLKGLANRFALKRADALHDQGMACREEDDEKALGLYLRALELDPERSSTLYNVGLIYKYRRDWVRSLEYNQRAFNLHPDSEATCWNLGIAATALGDWTAARKAWAACSIEIDPGEGPIDDNFGSGCVRLNPDDEAEVVWVQRIDPVRARILNVPFFNSGFFYGDVMLHDGAPMGTRVSGDREYSVFNAFERLTRSEYGTAIVALVAPSDADVARLVEASEAERLTAEDWTRASFLCKACSEGVTDAEHQHDPVWNRERQVGVAIHDEAVLRRVLAEWAKAGPERSAEIIDVVW